MTESERLLAKQVAVALAVPAIIMGLIPAAVTIVWVRGSLENRTSENKALIQRLEQSDKRLRATDEANRQIRRDLVVGLKRADVSNCLRVEKLYAQERAEARRNFRELGRNLRLLRIEKTPEIVALARQNRDRQLERFQAKPGGCGQLPPPPGGTG
jgi:hypothetical protein